MPTVQANPTALSRGAKTSSDNTPKPIDTKRVAALLAREYNESLGIVHSGVTSNSSIGVGTNADITLNALIIDEPPPTSTPHSQFSLSSSSREESDCSDSDSSALSNSFYTIPDFHCVSKEKQVKHEEKERKKKYILNGCVHSSIHLDSALKEEGREVEEVCEQNGEKSQEMGAATQRHDESDSGGSARAKTPLSELRGAAGCQPSNAPLAGLGTLAGIWWGGVGSINLEFHYRALQIRSFRSISPLKLMQFPLLRSHLRERRWMESALDTAVCRSKTLVRQRGVACDT